MSKRKLFHWLGILISLFVVSFFIFTIIVQDYLKLIISENVSSFGWIFVILISAVLESTPQYIAPYAVILDAAILGFSGYFIIFLVIIGASIGSLFGFWLGRRYGRELSKEVFGNEKVERVEKMINNYGIWVILVAAISPLPYIPMIFGALSMTRKNFIFFGIVPRIIGYAVVGSFFV